MENNFSNKSYVVNPLKSHYNVYPGNKSRWIRLIVIKPPVDILVVIKSDVWVL